MTAVLQSEATECGLACLVMVARYHGLRIDLATLRQRHPASQKGMSLPQLLQAAGRLQLAPRPLRLTLDELPRLATPCLLHWDFQHFVVLERCTGKGAIIVDPAVGRRTVTRAELDRAFTGVAIEAMPTPAFERGRFGLRLRLRDVLHGTTGLWRSLAVVLLLSVTLQVLALLLPYYSQLVFDRVMPGADRELLQLLVVVFALLVTVQAALTWLRSWVVLLAGVRVNLQWTKRVFRHLLRLPLDFFEKRHLGDIQSRFGSVAALQQLVTGQFVEAVVDGTMALSTFAVLYLYEPRLAAAVLLSVLLYTALRALFYPAQLQAAAEALAAAARRDSCFLESVRAARAVKAFGNEASRERLFAERLTEAWQAAVGSARLGLWQSTLRQLLFALQLVAVVWLGALGVLGGQLTPGMLVAILAYRALFTERAAALVDRVLEFRLARLQLDRLADIVHARPEPAFDSPPQPARRCPRLAISARGITHRYADGEPAILRNVSLDIAPGESVVLTGPSGCGKTTLLKILMGLLSPAAGEVRINGMPLPVFGVRNFRAQSGCVMQDDTLLSGTLLDNITLFAQQPDAGRARACAQLADIDRVIERMPMQYQTLVGDMGAALSGGQRQRLLLARALYRGPRVLFLDEFTNQLDDDSEARIHAHLESLRLTVVAVAHSATGIAAAHRRIALNVAG